MNKGKKEATNQPLVCIGVASYNNSRFITETLDSIASQTYKNIEVIISEDASSDNSLILIKEWINRNPCVPVELIVNKKNLGLCRSANNILRKAKGDYICLIGSDDKYLCEFIEKRVQLLKSTDSSVGLCYSMTYKINEKGERIGVDERKSNPSGFLFEHITSGYGSFCKPFTNLIKREVFEKVGYYDESLMYEDWDWYLRASKEFKFVFYDSLDSEYRVLPNSLGTKIYSESGIESQLLIIQKHLGESKIADDNFNNRLFRLLKTSYVRNYKIAKSVGKIIIKHFCSTKTILIYLLIILKIPADLIYKLKLINKS